MKKFAATALVMASVAFFTTAGTTEAASESNHSRVAVTIYSTSGSAGDIIPAVGR